MKIGIKCEIHDCTIALVKFFEEEDVIEKGTSKILEDDKELRIDNQYYLKNKSVNVDFEKLSDFMLSIKSSLEKIDSEKIEKLREKIEEF